MLPAPPRMILLWLQGVVAPVEIQTLMKVVAKL